MKRIAAKKEEKEAIKADLIKVKPTEQFSHHEPIQVLEERD